MLDSDLQRIDEKFQNLVNRFKEINAKNEGLTKQLRVQTEKMNQQSVTIEELRQQVEALRVVESIEQVKTEEDSEKKELKSVINTYIKEIDRCIAYLNK